jgi:hypothetical protein
VSGLYAQLDELRQVYGSESIEEILEGTIDGKGRLNRLVELRSKTMVTVDDREEIQFLTRLFVRYLHNLARQKAQARTVGLCCH